MTPDARAQVAREVLTELAEAMGAEGNGGGGRVLRFRDEQFPPPSPVPPPIPLGAVVGYHEWTGDAWAHRLVHAPNGEARCVSPDDDLHFALTALYHARREAEEAKCRKGQADAWCAVFDTLEVVRPGFTHVGLSGQEAAVRAIRELKSERDAARRELAAQKETANSLISENAAEKENAPASAPRRWWLLVDCDETPRAAYEWDERHVADADAAGYNRSDDTFAPFAVVPVVEARVTREQYDRVVRECFCSIPHGGIRAMLTALGLTVEDDHA